MSGELLSTNIGEKREEISDPRVESLAILLTRDYAEKNYSKREDGTFEPVWRDVNGAAVDIANQSYDEYPEYWKEQNRGAAKFLIELMDERGADALSALDLEDEEVRVEYGDLIHENWISRNEWVKDPNRGNPRLACSFVELSPEEQQKDIDQLGVLQRWIADYSEEDEEY